MTTVVMTRIVIQVRLSEPENDQLRRDAHAAGMTITEWIKFCCLDHRPPPEGGRDDA